MLDKNALMQDTLGKMPPVGAGSSPLSDPASGPVSGAGGEVQGKVTDLRSVVESSVSDPSVKQQALSLLDQLSSLLVSV